MREDKSQTVSGPFIVARGPAGAGDGAMADQRSELANSTARAVWDTIWLVAQLPGMTESYEWLLKYGEMVTYGVPSRAAAALLLEMIEAAETSYPGRARVGDVPDDHQPRP